MPIPIDRREFLKLALLTASAELAPPRSWSFTPQALPRASSSKKVLIVGAGLAGLVAGYELTRRATRSQFLRRSYAPAGEFRLYANSPTACMPKREQREFRTITT